MQKVIFGGDIGTPKSVGYFVNSLQHLPLSVSLGNHDRDEQGVATMGAYSADNITFDFISPDDYRYIVLDSSKGYIAKSKKQWLTSAMDTEKQIILAVHHPIIPVPSYIDHKHALEGRERIQEILHMNRNEVTVLCGHYHLEDERRKGNIRQLVTPAASYLIEKSEELVFRDQLFGYRLLKISPQCIETEVIYLKPN